MSRCLIITPNDYNWLLNGEGDGCFLVEAPGGGYNVSWYLCRHGGNLYFVFQSYVGTRGQRYYHYSARRTGFDTEIRDLLYSHGGGIYQNGRVTPYAQIAGPRPEPEYNGHDPFDFDALQGDDYPHYPTQR